MPPQLFTLGLNYNVHGLIGTMQWLGFNGNGQREGSEESTKALGLGVPQIKKGAVKKERSQTALETTRTAYQDQRPGGFY
jgi:hypothetical protein